MSFAAAAGSTAPTTIHTDTQGLSHGDFELAVPGGPVAAYYAAPGRARAITHRAVVVQEISSACTSTSRISAAAWRTMAIWRFSVNLYQRQGDASRYDNIPRLVAELVSKVPDESRSMPTWTPAWPGLCRPWRRCRAGWGVTGFCWADAPPWMYAARNPAVKAGVALVRPACPQAMAP